MRARAALTSLATYGAGGWTAAAFCNHRQPALRHAAELHARHLRAGALDHRDWQHAGVAVNGQRPADDLGLRKPASL